MGTSSDTIGPSASPRETPMVVEVLNRLRTSHNAKARDKATKGQKVDESEPNPGFVVDMHAGFDHSCAMTQNGDIYMFGYNIDGQLGFGDTKDRTEPTKLNFFKENNINIKSIACGQDTSGFITGNLLLSLFLSLTLLYLIILSLLLSYPLLLSLTLSYSLLISLR